MRISTGLIPALASLLLLAGCSTFEKRTPPPCPRISILADAANMTRFKAGTGRDITDVELLAGIASYKGSCTYNIDTRIMTVVFQLGIDAERGPAMSGRTTSLSYFVAMPAFYPKEDAKQVMSVSMTFPENSNRIKVVDEEVSVDFAISDFKELPRYEVFLGLQLDPEQLEFNRDSQHKK
ncbi:MAG: hypothetical protein VB101_01885 [Rhodospirillaceae bacterium]|nr:hypothetical protein [Rhodospirillaceae bacterium]MEA4837022.1 hypothetical protein [Rhodospirillaceae bacterium]